MANFIGLLAAKTALISSLQGGGCRGIIRGFRVYTSEGAHKCVAQAVEMAGLDLIHIVADLSALSSADGDGDVMSEDRQSLRRIPVDDQHRMRVDLLEEAIVKDRTNGSIHPSVHVSLCTLYCCLAIRE
jgi:glutamate/tyrosine decarboxylase-like PLP-dependent enzyme